MAAILLGFALAQPGLHAETEPEPTNGNQEVPERRTADGNATNTRSSSENTVLPAPAPRKLGFHAERITFSSLVGAPISAPTGSLIDHEKNYDDYLRFQIQTGSITNDILGLQAQFFNPVYESGAMGVWDLEAAISNHFGAGASLLFSSTSTRRQDVFPFKDSNDRYLMLYPDKRVLYSEGALLGFLSFHPITESRFDPYIKLRAGITFAHGYAHRYTSPDPFEFEPDLNNARGAIYGASVGFNLYINPNSALTLEYTSLGRSISADQFSRRTLNNDYLSLGLTFATE
ncbi:MAG: hypothetical protein CMN76_03570 [Spirochaetaceae bacterium]|nr:hypothetical protein [Spirochaetaceae bacterium]|tara:strand:+ start:171196 stop:172059 length:864 start_codon:yes stop_codon:yes gene_type:complete